MAYQVLARKYRPQRFADVAGQEHVTRTLLHALEQGRIAHGYIFSGHRGIGKTTIARILAQALNCRTAVGTPERPTQEPCGVCDACTEIRAGNAVDVLEIDAATNRGIDEIRELREAARYRPARDQYKIWILDEAHQITDAAFNALLKTLEEPPEHVVFMMATTQPEDIPQTIRSRCQHFSFHAVKFEDILTQLRSIAGHEAIDADDAALALLAEAGDGSMRDALSIMDQAIASAPVVDGRPHVAAEAIRELMGSVPNTVFERLMEAISAGQTATVIEEMNTLLNAGNSPAAVARQFVRYLRNTLIAKIGGENTDVLQISADERTRAARSAVLFSEEDLTRFLQVMLRTFDDLNYRQEQRFHLELGLVKLVHLQRLLPVEEILSQVQGTGHRSQGPGGAGPGSSAAGARSSNPGVQVRVAGQVRATAPAAAKGTSEVTGDRLQGAEANVQRSAFGVQETKPAASGMQVQTPTESLGPAAAGPQQHTAAAVAEPVEDVAETGPVPPPEAAPSGAPDLDRIRDAVCAALAREGHETAAAQVMSGEWTQQGNAIQVGLPMRRTMLALTINGDAEAICRKAMKAIGATQKIAFVPSENGATNGAAAAKAPVPMAGSAQSAALENPLVRKTQELFKAEIRSVLDLREPD
ncbi:MAG TPA: DNA polymerase III subunit gamma/tau [Acidobacteriaceae bacterium]